MKEPIVSVGFKLTKVLQLKRALVDLRMKKLGLSRTQWRVLLWMTLLGPCPQKSLLGHMDIDAAQLTRVLDEFEKSKIVLRARMPEDRRALLVEMTPLGKKKYESHLRRILKEESAILVEGLTSEEQEFFNQVLDKIQINMERLLNSKKNRL